MLNVGGVIATIPVKSEVVRIDKDIEYTFKLPELATLPNSAAVGLVFNAAKKKWKSDMYNIAFKLDPGKHYWDLHVGYLGKRVIRFDSSPGWWRPSGRTAARVNVDFGEGSIPIGDISPCTVAIDSLRQDGNVILSFFFSPNVEHNYACISQVVVSVGTKITSVQVQPDTPLLKSSAEVDTRIVIKASMDTFLGQNIGNAWFKSATVELIDRPSLSKVVKGKACTFSEKCALFDQNVFDDEILKEYGLLRYFLWFIITGGKKDIYILRQTRTKEFLRRLEESPYRIWINSFTSEMYSGYDKYFIR